MAVPCIHNPSDQMLETLDLLAGPWSFFVQLSAAHGLANLEASARAQAQRLNERLPYAPWWNFEKTACPRLSAQHACSHIVATADGADECSASTVWQHNSAAARVPAQKDRGVKDLRKPPLSKRTENGTESQPTQRQPYFREVLKRSKQHPGVESDETASTPDRIAVRHTVNEDAGLGSRAVSSACATDNHQEPNRPRASKRRSSEGDRHRPRKAQRIEDFPAQWLLAKILEGAADFQQDKGAQVSWLSDIELLKPKGCAVDVDSLLGEHEKYADAACTRSWQATFLASCAALLQRRRPMFPQDAATKQLRYRRRIFAQLIINLINKLSESVGQTAFKIIPALSASKSKLTPQSAMIRNTIGKGTPELIAEVSQGLLSDKCKWIDIDARVALDPALYLTWSNGVPTYLEASQESEDQFQWAPSRTDAIRRVAGRDDTPMEGGPLPESTRHLSPSQNMDHQHPDLTSEMPQGGGACIDDVPLFSGDPLGWDMFMMGRADDLHWSENNLADLLRLDMPLSIYDNLSHSPFT
ncbi:hypothetical protein EJ03DRAFT_336988 [Teratosphaeria nubilosa]|uniref:Uncharacterized protein n=1 Tax=Teratosphaeria nubilosa TaxID=161662 RepID=A0A6G1L636_9PEZI|nr:hypothetical protein EJ03DRAFT_336988 [Teratosphaeria nubilosa]